MCKAEIEILHDMVKSTIEEEKATQLIRKIISIRNLCKTLGDLIKNIVGEIDKSREQMFRILESIAVLEINKDAKKFNLEKTKHSKPSDTYQKSEVERRKSTDSSTKINSSSSKTKKHSQSVSSYSSGG